MMERCMMNDKGKPDDKRKRLIETTIKNLKMASVMKCWISNLNSAVFNNEISRKQLEEFWKADASGFCNNSSILK